MRFKGRPLVWAFIAIFFSVFLIFQNCSKVMFVEGDVHNPPSLNALNDSETVDDPDGLTTPPVAGGSNGDSYDGKVVRYFNFSEVSECVAGEVSIKGEIQEYKQSYTLVTQNCEPIPAIAIPENEVTVVAEGLIYEGADYIRTYPRSCLEIYETGGDQISNGFYLIDSDGPGGTAASSQYCDMYLISGGWSPWSPWSECDVTCGIGEQRRTRSCDSGGCTGPDTEIRQCQMDPC